MGTSRSRGTTQSSIELTNNVLEESPAAARSERAAENCFARPVAKRFFGRRKGRVLSEYRSSLLARRLDEVRVDLSVDAPEAGSLLSLFPAEVIEVWLEIGFGRGEHLIWQAEHNPATGIIGAEPFVNGVAATLAEAERRDLSSRVRCHPEDVTTLLAWLPSASLSRAFMLFPDPWPKNRHRDRRLLSTHLLDALSGRLADNAEFRFASDIQEYARFAIELAQAHPDFALEAVFTSAERDRRQDWPQTRYEAKALKEGRSSTFLKLKRRRR